MGPSSLKSKNYMNGKLWITSIAFNNGQPSPSTDTGVRRRILFSWARAGCSSTRALWVEVWAWVMSTMSVGLKVARQQRACEAVNTTRAASGHKSRCCLLHGRALGCLPVCLRGKLVFTDLVPGSETSNTTPERTGTNTRKHCRHHANLDKSLSRNEKMI